MVMEEPRLRASYKVANKELVFKFVGEQGRADLLVPSIHWKSFDSFVGETIEKGETLPEEITTYYESRIKLIKEK